MFVLPATFAGLPYASTDLTVTEKDRKSTRLNSSHLVISYAVFCLKKKKTSSCGVMRTGAERGRTRSLACCGVSCRTCARLGRPYTVMPDRARGTRHHTREPCLADC